MKPRIPATSSAATCTGTSIRIRLPQRCSISFDGRPPDLACESLHEPMKRNRRRNARDIHLSNFFSQVANRFCGHLVQQHLCNPLYSLLARRALETSYTNVVSCAGASTGTHSDPRVY
jgi:hypothetical protein